MKQKPNLHPFCSLVLDNTGELKTDLISDVLAVVAKQADNVSSLSQTPNFSRHGKPLSKKPALPSFDSAKPMRDLAINRQ